MCVRVGERAIRYILCAMSLFATVALAGCNDYSNPASATGVQLASASSISAVGPRTYVLRPNDQIRLQIYCETNASGVYTIDGGGAVSIPLAGRIHAAEPLNAPEGNMRRYLTHRSPIHRRPPHELIEGQWLHGFYQARLISVPTIINLL